MGCEEALLGTNAEGDDGRGQVTVERSMLVNDRDWKERIWDLLSVGRTLGLPQSGHVSLLCIFDMLLERSFRCLTRGDRLACPILRKAVIMMSSPPGKHDECLSLLLSLPSNVLPGQR